MNFHLIERVLWLLDLHAVAALPVGGGAPKHPRLLLQPCLTKQIDR